ncbi:Zn-dependent hydrolase [Alkalihalobacillus trypoxylicola]|uniref:Zn-dependent hydrolase n=1 Tax=Alkalihalobacillus trypoxylicola TaxID=519424 RepID=A0A161Q1Z0_9BACI|nr:Zn-dependent hydrolase [Alkalihalobacillus trypoxylicola]KYG29533.1 Zn-dependent hydrolase [Alkalihalobacillus trypoxylicola]
MNDNHSSFAKSLINEGRLMNHLDELSRIGLNPKTGGINRFSFTKEEEEANSLIKKYMEEAGMTVSIDGIGNVIGSYGQGDEVIMLGSHIDTVPEGGKYDGALGVITAIEIVHSLHEQQITPSVRIEVVSFKDEEGTRFGFGLIGSKAMAGLLTDEQLNNFDEKGNSIKSMLPNHAFPLNKWKRTNIKAYLEMHIEQGRVLENQHLPVGVVTGIAAPIWQEITLNGRSEHAGATPMNVRSDALTAAAEMILKVEELLNKSDSAAVGTVGKLHVTPNGVNVIPGQVTFSIDLRDIDEEQLELLNGHILEELNKIATKREISFSSKLLQRVTPVKTDYYLQKLLESSIKKHHIEPFSLISGAGHDAMNIAQIAPVVMLFVRSKDGISHNPLEYSSREDILTATHVLYDTVLELIN